jgi:hypothetical protein
VHLASGCMKICTNKNFLRTSSATSLQVLEKTSASLLLRMHTVCIQRAKKCAQWGSNPRLKRAP